MEAIDMDDDVRGYIQAIPAQHRPLFDRLHRLVQTVHPEAVVVLSYKMPTYRVGTHKLHVGVWKHGLSVYGWRQGGDATFVSKHPETKSGRGTIRLTPTEAESISDDELCGLVRAALDD